MKLKIFNLFKTNVPIAVMHGVIYRRACKSSKLVNFNTDNTVSFATLEHQDNRMCFLIER